MSRVLIVTAHLDDFELGMGGAATRMAALDCDVTVIVLCRGDRPGVEDVQHSRKIACDCNIRQLGFDLIKYNYSDTKLDQIPQTEICNIIHSVISEINPEIVYTHYSHDVHKDHCIVSGATRVACRMRESSSVKELYEFSIPGSTEWGFNVSGFNKFVDISQYSTEKMGLISQYRSELRPTPDPMSLDMITARDQYHGSLCGYMSAEVFKIIYMR